MATSHAKVALINTMHDLSSGGTAHEAGGGGATSQPDLPSLTPLFLAVVVDCN